MGKEEKESNTIEIAHFGELDLEETIIQQLCCLDPIVRRQPWLLPPSDKRNKEKKKKPTLQKDDAGFTSRAVAEGGAGSS